MTNFKCNICNYVATKKNNYDRHIKTKKHKNNVEINQKKEENKRRCIYCDILVYDKQTLNKHLTRCKERKLYEADLKEKKIKEMQKELKKVKEEKEQVLRKKDDEINKLYQDHFKLLEKILNKDTSNITLNNNSNNNSINMYYIMNNFNNIENYEKIMAEPLSNKERKYIEDNGALIGCLKLLEERCVNLPINERPIHCLDVARNKFLIRSDNKWKIDDKGVIIVSEAIKIINNMYKNDMDKNTETMIQNLRDMIELKDKGPSKIVKYMARKTNLKK